MKVEKEVCCRRRVRARVSVSPLVVAVLPDKSTPLKKVSSLYGCVYVLMCLTKSK